MKVCQRYSVEWYVELVGVPDLRHPTTLASSVDQEPQGTCQYYGDGMGRLSGMESKDATLLEALWKDATLLEALVLSD